MVNQIQCPKCGHSQDNGDTCAYCGIVFMKTIGNRARENPTGKAETEMDRFVSAVKEGIIADQHRNRRLRWVVPVRIGIVLLFLSLLSAGIYRGHHGVTRYRQLLSRDWPATEGTVVFSDLRTEIEFRLGHESEIGTTRYDPNQYYMRPAIAYRYRVDGREYTGTTVSFTGEKGKAYSRQIVDRYPLGSQCPVYYNPNSAAASVLMPGLPGISKLDCTAEVALGFLLSACGVIGIFYKKPIFLALHLGTVDQFGKKK